VRLADGEGEAVSAIGPGDWVECVDNSCGQLEAWSAGERLEKGAVYQIGDCWVDTHTLKEVVSIVGRERVAGSRRKGRRLGYSINRFRPIYRPKADLIESLKAPPVRVGEFA